MSTRRARIKAITSLPPRRKIAENSDNKIKQCLQKDELDKATKSPKTPRQSYANTREEFKKISPVTNLVPSPRSKPSSTLKVALETKVTSPAIEKSCTPNVVEHVLLNDNVFLSPQAVSSPHRRPIVSPAKTFNFNTIENSIHKLTVASEINSDIKGNITISDINKNVEKSNNILIKQNNDNEIESRIIDDYNVPSIPESIPEDAVMDGIVPLQPANNVPKPIDLLKNEIISETAQVLFDPIVPLPSPSKVRPKLRPVPRLAPLRRNSIQGSASESEDESRRALHGGSATPGPARQRHDSHTSHSTVPSISNRETNRVRNDSICSSVSQTPAPAPPATSPVKEKHITKSRRQEMASRRHAMRRKLAPAQRDTLTMYDYIFYNPTTNPIIPDPDELQAKEANQKEEERLSKENNVENDKTPSQDSAPVPQIKLGPNGELILDEKSLVIKTSSDRVVSSVVREGAWGAWGAARGRYRRAARTADWTDDETVRFYRALAALGTDFSLMEPLFPDRKRRDLKLKFKKEEKVNSAQIDKALRSGHQWDAARLKEEFREERAAAKKKAQEEQERVKREARDEKRRMRTAKDLGIRPSRSSKALGTSVMPNHVMGPSSEPEPALTANSFIQRAINTRKKQKLERLETLELNKERRAQQSSKSQDFATLTSINGRPTSHPKTPDVVTTLSRLPKPIESQTPKMLSLHNVNSVTSNIETGSLVVFTVTDPNSPTKKMLQTYVAHSPGVLTPVALPPTLLNSVVGYMKGTPKSGVSSTSSPQLTSPSSVASLDSRTSMTPNSIPNASPAKRQRHTSYTITQL